MVIFKELNITTTFLFCIIFLGFAVITSALIPVTNEVWDDISLILIISSLIASLFTIVLSLSLFSKGKIWSKIFAIIFILVIVLFEYIGVKEFVSIF